MSPNPVSRIRTFGSVAVVTVSFVALAVLFLTESPTAPWVIAIAVTALGFAALSAYAHMRYPEASDKAWDEMNRHAHRSSLAFGYWTALGVFVALMGAVSFAELDARIAFYWMGPVLGLAPTLHFLTSVLRGQAE